jgi:hypothetical protein
MARFEAVLATAIGIPPACYVAWHIGVMTRMLRHLRLRRITPLLLSEKTMAGEPIAILDLLGFEEAQRDRAGSPRAVRMDPVLPFFEISAVLSCSQQIFRGGRLNTGPELS